MNKSELKEKSRNETQDITLEAKNIPYKRLDSLHGNSIDKKLYLLDDKIIHTRDIETWTYKSENKTVIEYENISSFNFESSVITRIGKLYGSIMSIIGLLLTIVFGIDVINNSLEGNLLAGFLLFIGGLMVLYSVNYLRKSKEKIVISEGGLTYKLSGEESDLETVYDYVVEK